ncbi:vWA domain-containing protein [Roseibium suaedae]|uniref:Ca-activated chloride channel family protein n=1 Tax=Roseibium suaedae TaxID=735517 RepID=A0A1M7MPT5_9HYPH|nr:VWA domain-containing protein [Roseibium suaedae]SHM92953.1 Ca-activated chloride channel family protein [Roseibium suaedae]
MRFQKVSRRLRARAPAVLALALAGLGQFSVVTRAEDTRPDMMFVLDLSNSMWGQINGTAKVEIAKDAFSGFLGELPDGVNAGLMAYGHRRKSDCGDVETLVPVTPLDRGKLEASVKSLKPRGKTPITEALRMAAQELGSRDKPGRLVLISDGIETCNGDPCALAAELAKSGVDFKAHVIGFDIASKADQAKIACIAHLTGGTYWNVKDAGGLAEALRETAQAAPEQVLEFPVVLTAADKDSGARIDGNVDWVISKADDETVVGSGLHGGQVELKLPPGDYVVSAELDERAGGASFTVSDQGAKQTVLLAGNLPEATIALAASQAVATSRIDVAFTGPLADSDFIRVVTPDGQRLERDLWAYVRDGSPVSLPLPSEPGSYQVAYVWTEYGERILAKAPVEVTEAKVNLTFASEVSAGMLFEVTWEGPGGQDDWIGIVPQGAPSDDYGGRWSGVSNGSPVTLQAPVEAGNFEVIYVAGADQGILARKPLAVGEAKAGMQAPSEVEASLIFEVTWTGPKGPDDWIGVSVPGSDPAAYLTYARPEGETVRLMSPVKPGSYELRYILSGEGATRILASQPLEIKTPLITLEGPEEAEVGKPMTIKVAGPANGSNWVGFAKVGEPAGAYISGAWATIDDITDGTFDLMAPEEPGAYELRFVLSGDDTVIAASRPVTLK